MCVCVCVCVCVRACVCVCVRACHTPDELLVLQDSVFLKPFKVVLLICCVLVHNKQVTSPLCNNETQVELNGRRSGNENQ